MIDWWRNDLHKSISVVTKQPLSKDATYGIISVYILYLLLFYIRLNEWGSFYVSLLNISICNYFVAAKAESKKNSVKKPQ